MLLVYALTRATTDGWGAPLTVGLLAASVALVLGFLVIEHRSPQPLLPLRIFRLPTLAAANVTMTILGAVTFSEFFVLSLYVRDVLHYSAMQSGAAFVAFGLSVVAASNLAQWLVARVGVRATLTAGILASAVSMAWLMRLPLHGDYLVDLFPGYVLGGAGLGLSIVPITIASLAGVQRADAGIASGLVNASRQIGGALGLAAVSAIAATAARSYATTNDVAAGSGAALAHGFRVSLVVLFGVLVVAAAIAAVFVKPQPLARREPVEELQPLREAA
jgi:predicted MFS family arabinose efflux permease